MIEDTRIEIELKGDEDNIICESTRLMKVALSSDGPFLVLLKTWYKPDGSVSSFTKEYFSNKRIHSATMKVVRRMTS